MSTSMAANGLEHDPEKREAVCGKDHAPRTSLSGMTIRRKVTPLQESRGFADGGKCSTMRAGQSQEGLMPEVVFYALGGRSIEQKRALIKDFTDAVVKNYKVDPSAVTITIVESAKEDKAKGGVLFSDMGAAKT
jgi:4-oxalocrotonate tautomerase